jgi:lipoyl(octanoyl) transferase
MSESVADIESAGVSGGGEIVGSSSELPCRWLGRVAYADGLIMQEEIMARLLAGENADAILLLEHDPVFTIGRTPDRTSLGDPAALPAPLVEISRGGKATWHGPGQLVGYPILRLVRYGQDLHAYLRALEQALIEGTRELGIAADRREGLTGVWIGARKLASIGVGARQWISQHGFAINICGALEGFAAITPCGIDGVEMTSLEREGAALTVETAAAHFAPHLLRCLQALRAQD